MCRQTSWRAAATLFDLLRETIRKDLQVSLDGRVYFGASILVRIAGRALTWELPLEDVPSGVVQLREGDAQFDRFLAVQQVAEED